MGMFQAGLSITRVASTCGTSTNELSLMNVTQSLRMNPFRVWREVKRVLGRVGKENLNFFSFESQKRQWEQKLCICLSMSTKNSFESHFVVSGVESHFLVCDPGNLDFAEQILMPCAHGALPAARMFGGA